MRAAAAAAARGRRKENRAGRAGSSSPSRGECKATDVVVRDISLISSIDRSVNSTSGLAMAAAGRTNACGDVRGRVDGEGS